MYQLLIEVNKDIMKVLIFLIVTNDNQVNLSGIFLELFQEFS